MFAFVPWAAFRKRSWRRSLAAEASGDGGPQQVPRALQDIVQVRRRRGEKARDRRQIRRVLHPIAGQLGVAPSTFDAVDAGRARAIQVCGKPAGFFGPHQPPPLVVHRGLVPRVRITHEESEEVAFRLLPRNLTQAHAGVDVEQLGGELDGRPLEPGGGVQCVGGRGVGIGETSLADQQVTDLAVGVRGPAQLRRPQLGLPSFPWTSERLEYVTEDEEDLLILGAHFQFLDQTSPELLPDAWLGLA